MTIVLYVIHFAAFCASQMDSSPDDWCIAADSPYTIRLRRELSMADSKLAVSSASTGAEAVFQSSPVRTAKVGQALVAKVGQPLAGSPNKAVSPKKPTPAIIVDDTVAKRPAAKDSVKKRPSAADCEVLKKPSSASVVDCDDSDNAPLVQKRVGEEEEEGRDPKKAKRFKSLWEKGALPDAVVTKATEAKKQGRAAFTKVINTYLQKQGHHYVQCGEHPLFKETLTRTQTGYGDEFHEGIIYAEAVGRCFGHENLIAAVKRGTVLTMGNGEWEDLQFFFSEGEGGCTDVIQPVGCPFAGEASYGRVLPRFR